MEDKHRVENKSCNKHSILTRWGLSHQVSYALQKLRAKHNASTVVDRIFEEQKMHREVERHEAEIVTNVLGEDTVERLAYRNFHGV